MTSASAMISSSAPSLATSSLFSSSPQQLALDQAIKKAKEAREEYDAISLKKKTPLPELNRIKDNLSEAIRVVDTYRNAENTLYVDSEMSLVANAFNGILEKIEKTKTIERANALLSQQAQAPRRRSVQFASSPVNKETAASTIPASWNAFVQSADRRLADVMKRIKALSKENSEKLEALRGSKKADSSKSMQTSIPPANVRELFSPRSSPQLRPPKADLQQILDLSSPMAAPSADSNPTKTTVSLPALSLETSPDEASDLAEQSTSKPSTLSDLSPNVQAFAEYNSPNASSSSAAAARTLEAPLSPSVSSEPRGDDEEIDVEASQRLNVLLARTAVEAFTANPETALSTEELAKQFRSAGNEDAAKSVELGTLFKDGAISPTYHD